MKSILYIIIIITVISCSDNQQTTLAQWTFPAGTSRDALPDAGTQANLAKVIEAIGTSEIDFTKSGFSTRAAQVSRWDKGKGIKFWQIEFNSLGYTSLTLSSRMQSGGKNPGPRDFKVQYKIGADSLWKDFPDDSLIASNEWESAHLDHIFLPSECGNQSSVFIRWVMNSNVSSAGSDVQPAGVNKIDEILISGTSIPVKK